MFYLENLKRQGMDSVPSDRLLQLNYNNGICHQSSPSNHSWLKTFHSVRENMAKMSRQALHRKRKHIYDPRHTCDCTLDREQTDTLVSHILVACLASGIKHFWADRADFVEGAMPESLSASQSLDPLIIYQASQPSCLPDTVIDLADIDPDCTVFKELCYLLCQGNISHNSTARSRSQVVKICDIVLVDTLNLSTLSCSNSPKDPPSRLHVIVINSRLSSLPRSSSNHFQSRLSVLRIPHSLAAFEDCPFQKCSP